MSIRLTRAVKALLIIYLLTFIIQQTGDRFFGTGILSLFGLVPFSFVYSHYYWQLFTFSFFHNDVFHLFFNGMLLAFVGGEIEQTWGVRRFLKYYFVCSIGAGIFYLVCSFLFLKSFQLNLPLTGSSGALYGLLMAYGLMFGERVFLFMLLFPLKAKHFIWVLALMELLTSLYSPGRGLSGLASIGGILSGLAYIWFRIWLKATLFTRNLNFKFNQRSKRTRSQHLKLVINNDSDPTNSDPEEEDPTEKPKTWH